MHSRILLCILLLNLQPSLCFILREPSPYHFPRKKRIIVKKMSGEDEFGDSSFSDDFDVDAAIEAANCTPVQFKPPAKRAKISPDVPPRPQQQNNGSLEECLQQYFGFSEFRPGQKQAVEGALSGRDVAVFWATGE
jgi:hypothetical protein